MTASDTPPRYALLSVYHKEGIVEFAQALVKHGFALLASGGTAKALIEADLPVRDVAELVGGGAMLGHKVVTLSRELHAGLLADPDNPDEVAEMMALDLPFIDLVCVDLYPLEQCSEDSTLAEIREKTDIGGPTMLRSAAKGQRIVVCDPSERELVIDWLDNGEPNSEWFRNQLAVKVESTVSRYCDLSAELLLAKSAELLLAKSAELNATEA